MLFGIFRMPLDDVETYRGGWNDDLRGALSAVTTAKRTMRSVGISLVIKSIDKSTPEDFAKVMAALKILEPSVCQKR